MHNDDEECKHSDTHIITDLIPSPLTNGTIKNPFSPTEDGIKSGFNAIYSESQKTAEQINRNTSHHDSQSKRHSEVSSRSDRFMHLMAV